MGRPALGLIETDSLAAAIAATEAAIGAAELSIASAERINDLCVAVRIEGDWNAVQKAVAAGARAAEQEGTVRSLHVIPRTDDDSRSLLPYVRFLSRYASAATPPPPPPKPKPTPKKKPATKPAGPSPIPKPTPAPAPPPRPAAPAAAPSGIDLSELERLPVVKLRQQARQIEGLPIQGRQISMANKDQLLEAIREVVGEG